MINQRGVDFVTPLFHKRIPNSGRIPKIQDPDGREYKNPEQLIDTHDFFKYLSRRNKLNQNEHQQTETQIQQIIRNVILP